MMQRDIEVHPEATTEAFISWLETKDPSGSFDFNSTDDCVWAQFVTHLGYDPYAVLYETWTSNKMVTWKIPVEVRVALLALEDANDTGGNEIILTYGETLAEVRKCCGRG